MGFQKSVWEIRDGRNIDKEIEMYGIYVYITIY